MNYGSLSKKKSIASHSGPQGESQRSKILGLKGTFEVTGTIHYLISAPQLELFECEACVVCLNHSKTWERGSWGGQEMGVC